MEETQVRGPRACENCGYRVDGLPRGPTGEAVCPECGAAVSSPRKPVDFPIVKIGIVSAGAGVLPYVALLMLIELSPLRRHADTGILTCGGILLSLCIAWFVSALWASRYIAAQHIVGKGGIAACMAAAMASVLVCTLLLTFVVPLLLGH